MSDDQRAFLAERRARLLRLLEMNAPDIIIADNCRLVLASFHGNHWRVIRALVVELTRITFARTRNHIQWRLHAAARACGLHLPFTTELLDGTMGCWVCDAQMNTAPQDQETEERE